MNAITWAERAATYVVKPGDVLRVRIIGLTESALAFQAEFPIEPDGNVYLPRIGAVQVGGQTVQQIRSGLRDKYAVLLSNPVVSVLPIFPVSVLGAVRAPATMNAVPGFTVFDAIAQAGGFLPEAKRNDIQLIRNGQVTELDAAEGNPNADEIASLQLQAGDRIVVGQRARWRETAGLIVQGAALLLTAFIAAR